jgi:CRISPR system Cascade subunit CasC
LCPQPPRRKKGRKSDKDQKKAAEKALPAEVKNQLERALDGGKAADLAMFGRMLADLPEKNIDAACQVAHALSTNKVSMEMDYYTAVDDLKKADEPGADMIGSVEFNSSCFYRYANVNLSLLNENLHEDDDLVHKAVEAFLRASVDAIPTGKQNGSAAYNMPSLILAVVRERGLWSLANAFVQPVRPSAAKSLVQNSIEALDAYWGKLVDTFGAESIRYVGFCTLDEVPLQSLRKPGEKGGTDSVPPSKKTLEDLIREVMSVVRGKPEREAAS